MKTTLSKTLKIALALILGIVFQVHSQVESSLLWKVSGNGLKEDSYVFGTIHLICPDQFKMDDRIKSAVQDADQIVLELDIDDPTLAQQMQSLSLNPGMKNIQSEVKEEYKKPLEDFLLANYGAGMAQLGILKPFVLSSMVVVKQLPCEQAESYEFFFSSQAKDQGKEVLGLETVEFQMSLFDQIPASIQLDELGKMVASNDSKDEFQQMVDAYVKEDLDGLYKIMLTGDMISAYSSLILDQRNENWIPKMKEMMGEKQTFFAVGSGHLAGEKGVINLLKQAGYTLEPIY